MSNYHHKHCNGEILPHPNNDAATCRACGRWIGSPDEIFIRWDIMNLSGNEAATVNG